MSADSPSTWAQAEPEAISLQLRDPGLQLTMAVARAVWQRVTSFRHSDPSVGHRLSLGLVVAAEASAGRGHPDPGIRAVAWCSLAESSNATGKIREAIEAFDRASGFAEEAGDPDLLGQILVGRIHVLALAGRTEESVRLARRAESLLRRGGNLPLLAKLFMNRGNAWYQQDRYREAYDTYRRADRIFEAAGIRDATRAGLLMNQAVAATNLAKFEEARRLFLRAEELAASLRLAHLDAFSRFNHAFLERIRGDYRGSLALLESAERTFVAQGSTDMVAASNRARAETYLELGMPARALDLLRSSVEAFVAEGMVLDADLARADEARALLDLGNAPEAVGLLGDLAGRFRVAKNPTREALTLSLLAEALLASGQARAALRQARRALAIFARRDLAAPALRARCQVANALVALGRPRQAEETLVPAMERLGSLATRSRMELWTAAGITAAACGEPEEANRRLRRAAKLLERERCFIPGVELRSRTFERQGRVYHQLLALELARDRPRFLRLRSLAERARGRSFTDRISRARPASMRPDPALDAKRILLGALTRRLEEAEVPESGAPDIQQARSLRRRVVSLENRMLQDLRRNEERESADGARARGAVAAGADGWLRRDEMLLEYLISGERVIAMALGAGRRTARVLPLDLRAIRECEDRFRFQLESMGLLAGSAPGVNLPFARRAADAALEELYRALVEPVMPPGASLSRLLVIPDGVLHRVPFQCLRDSGGYLGERMVVSRLPTAQLLRRRGARRRVRSRRVLVAGTTTGGPALVGREIDAVAAMFSARDACVLRDARAAEILTELERAGIVHLVSHGHYRDDNPLFSRLSTADGALFVADLLDRRLNCDLVVLSACQSGRVFTGGGDDLSGVAHAFLAAGARHLVASLWRVHDEATHDLMGAFYRHLTSGTARDPAVALHLAENEIRPRWDHPFFWGAFSAHGA